MAYKVTMEKTAVTATPASQMTIQKAKSKLARLDSVAMDKSHVVYMVETQKRNTKNLSRRSRFYQGHVDVSLLAPGTVNFNSMKDVCQIMVTPFDVFDRGLYRYTFKGVCVECPDLEIGDGAWRVFINTKGKNSHEFTQEFLDFMEYITKTTDTRAGRSESEKIKQYTGE